MPDIENELNDDEIEREGLYNALLEQLARFSPRVDPERSPDFFEGMWLLATEGSDEITANT